MGFLSLEDFFSEAPSLIVKVVFPLSTVLL